MEAGRLGGRKRRTRQRLLAAADALFYRQGIRATSVDAVAEEAGVTKVTLYSHFASKEDLLAGYLEERNRRWRDSIKDTLAAHDRAEDRLLAVFDAYREWLKTGEFRGCAFTNCAAEFPDPAHPAREVVRRHKAGVRELLRNLAAEAGLEDPASFSERLFLLLEGAYVTAALEGDERLFARMRPVVADLVRAAGGEAGAR